VTLAQEADWDSYRKGWTEGKYQAYWTIPPRPELPVPTTVPTNAHCPPLQAMTYDGCRPIGPVITLQPVVKPTG
ncbi:hypothetical protein ABZW03_31475, partial [Kitasatospora sp. NPDC004799]|uniref:hypothetical protein n=1 Tax=Kitasatospora sp. NPDC004799 TaxID=3154460 RepID=UPI0033BBF7CD